MAGAPLYAGRQYLFRSVCGTAGAEVTSIRDRIDLNSCLLLAADRLGLNDIGEAELTLSRALPVDACHETRDPKGLYRKARQGLIPNFTGINAPYEAPEAPELRLDTDRMSAEACAEAIITLLGTVITGEPCEGTRHRN